ncbi:ABC transporter-3 [Coleophoma cylindrospora]|uniref:ABC transporter-3 n=1 Tax=Coleophoma cylindrospora TaxID=1849047 RepID=A0A3D8QAK8_9HELO|nr:ABC transporter-3 [Coleophoma cylindrospora]
MNQVMIMVRGSLVTSIYRRTLELDTNKLEESAAVTLMSTDVEQVMLAFEDIHEVWANITQIGLAIWLLEQEVSWACVAPIVVSLVSIVVSVLLAPYVGRGQRRWNEAIQTRIDVTNNILGQMKEVKLLGLTEKLGPLVQRLRAIEIQVSAKFRKKLMMILAVSQVAPLFSPVATFAMYAIIAALSSRHSLLSAQSFTSLSLISLLSTPIVNLTQSVPVLASGIGCLTRIQEYLSSTTRKERRCWKSSQLQSYPSSLMPILSSEISHQDARPEMKLPTAARPMAIIIRKGQFGWGDKALPTLRKVCCSIPMSCLTLVVGPVGSGKTTFLRALLNELPEIDGEIEVHGCSFAFCDQNPWLINSTVQKNIIGGAPLNMEWYNTVLQACALTIDLATLPLGDQAVVGSKGMTLSRGQKQRIAIARSVYAKADIVVVDDALSGLDLRTEKQVFSQVFGKGGILQQIGATVIMATHATHLLLNADHIIILGNDGQIEDQGNFRELRARGGYVGNMIVQEQADAPTNDPVDSGSVSAASLTLNDYMATRTTELRENKLSDCSIYSYYLRAAGWANSCFFIINVTILAFCFNFPTLWLQWWSDANEKSPNADLGLYLGVYTALAVAGILSLSLACWYLMVRMVSRSSLQLHSIVLKTVMRAPLSFFANTDIGSITNRFSQDMRLIDMSLPMAAINTALLYFVQKFYLKTSRQLRLLDLEVKSPLYSNFIESLHGLVTIRAFNWSSELQKQNTDLLDESQKPVYLLYCVQRWLSLVLDMLVALLAIILVILTVLLKGSTSGGAIGVALINIMTFNQSLTNLIRWYTSLETALGAISRISKFETKTASEERASSMTEVSEKSWLSAGAIEFHDVSASHDGGSSMSLKNISMSVQPGQKIGICGRTGSGKSSFILSLCQMLDLSYGSISVDGVDLSTLPRETVRGGFNSITQEPFFIPATIRMNMDFNESLPDEIIIEALRKVKLWDFIEVKGGLDAKAVAESWSLGQQQLFCLARALLRKSPVLILDEVSSRFVSLFIAFTLSFINHQYLGSPTTVYEFVDPETDNLMQDIIRNEFAGCTIFSIAHRLNTIMDFDKIALLDNGSLIEFDAPAMLLSASPPSAFAQLYHSPLGSS